MARDASRRLAAALVTAAVFVLPAAAHAQVPVRPVSPLDRPELADTLPEVLVELRVEHGPDTTLLALQRDTTVLLPVRTLFGLLEVEVTEAVPARRLEARYGSGPTLILVDTEHHLARRGEASVPLERADVVWRGEEAFVSADVLARLLAVQITADWEDLMVLVSAAEELPIVQRLARDRRRAALLRPMEAPAPPVLLSTPAPLVDGLAVDWTVSASTIDPANNSSVGLGVGATVLGGGLDVQYTAARTPLTTTSLTLWQWTKAWQDRPWLRQVRVGDIATLGARPFGIKGVVISNQPFLRPAEFAVQDLAGRLAPGWEIEVYRSGELIGYQPVDSGGAYAVAVPVIYGPNPLETVQYGPNGAVRRRPQTFLIPQTRLPGRRFEYAVGGGECEGTRCQGMVNADARYGVSDRVTVQAGADHFWRDTLPDAFYPYGLATVAVTRPVSLTVEGVLHALGRGRVDVDPSPDLHADGSYTRFDTTVVDPLVGTANTSQQVDGGLFWRPGLLSGEFFLQANGVWRTSASRTRTTASLAATARVAGVRFVLGGRADHEAIVGAPSATTRGLDAGADGVVTRGVLHNTLMHATLSLECTDVGAGCAARLARWTAGFGRQLARILRLDFGLRKEMNAGVAVDVTLQMNTPWTRATSRNSWDDANGVTGTQLLEGTVLWDRRTGRLGMANGRNLGRSGVAGVVFLDQNNNGRRDGDDIVLPGVELRVGSDAVITDSLGRFSVWDLVPFTDATIEVDTLALENPLWLPAAPVSRVVPAPNSFRFVEVPIRAGGELAGRVEMDGQPLPGATLALREESSGRIREISTFTDATFYVMRLAPGRYTLAPAAGLLEQLHAHAEVVEFEIGGRGEYHVDAVVRIQR
jgi:hypothetical protein